MSTFDVTDYGAVGDGSNNATAISAATAAAAAAGGIVRFPAGTYGVSSDIIFPSNVQLEFDPGAILSPDTGIVLTINNQARAGLTQCFGTDGTVLLKGDVLPQWFGAISDLGSPTIAQAQVNTLAFRKACKSAADEWDLQTIFGGLFRVTVPAGTYRLANGFTAPPGVHVLGSGSGSSALICLDATNDPVEPQIPLLQLGTVLTGSGSGLGYTGALGVWISAPAPQATNLFFQSQSGTRSAFSNRAFGALFSRLWFNSCGISLDIGGGDVIGSDIVVDQGLNGIVFSSASDVRLTNLIFYNINYELTFNDGCYDITIENYNGEYCKYDNIVVAGQCKNVKLNGVSFVMNASYSGTFAGCVRFNAAGELDICNVQARNLSNGFIIVEQPGAICRVTNAVLDQNKTNSAYDQNTGMYAAYVANGAEVIFRNVECRNFGSTAVFVPGSTAGTHFEWHGGRIVTPSYLTSTQTISQTNPNAAVVVTNVDGGGRELITPCSGARPEIRNCRNWFAQVDDGTTYVYVRIPYSDYNMWQIAVAANPNPGGSTLYRRTNLYAVTKSTAYASSVTSYIETVTLLESVLGATAPPISVSLGFGTFVNGTTIVGGSDNGWMVVGVLRTLANIAFDVQPQI